MHDWRGFNARPDQVAPDGDWDIWIALAGRGWGKTRTGAEWVREKVESGEAKRIALIAETAADCRDVLVEGDSGILSLYPEGEGPVYEPSKRRLTWSNGAVATLFNATEPKQLRGPQYDLAWSDELAKWRYARETWDQLQFGLRLGDNPQQIVTTTPRPIEIVKAIMAGKEGKVTITHGKTMDNASNLAAKFLRKIREKYEGTRLGRQELDAEILGDIPNALFTLDNIDLFRIRNTDPDQLGRAVSPSSMDKVIVAVDPAITSNAEGDSDEHGIVCGGICKETKEVLILEDGSIHGTPLEWAKAAIALFDRWEADWIVVETNQGGEMVAQTIKSIRADINVKSRWATKSKHVRADPYSSLYQQGRVRHVGSFPELETQMTQMTNVGYEGEGSPDRLDALVWLLTELFPSIVNKKKPTPVMAPTIYNPMARM